MDTVPGRRSEDWQVRPGHVDEAEVSASLWGRGRRHNSGPRRSRYSNGSGPGPRPDSGRSPGRPESSCRAPMAIAAEGHDLRRRGQPGPGDRRLGEVRLDRRPMVAPGAVATLAADALIAALGTAVGLTGGAEVRRVAVQAPAGRLGRDRTAQEARIVGRGRGVLHRPAPLRRARILRDPQLADLPVALAPRNDRPWWFAPGRTRPRRGRLSAATVVTASTRSPSRANRCETRGSWIGDVPVGPG